MACVSQPSPLAPARQRALALSSSGNLAEARAVLEQAVELGKLNLSEDDPAVLATAFELGRVLQQGDDPMGARRVLEEAYAAGQWRLGDSDPLMLQISHDIGAVAEELGNRHEARKAFTRVAELGPGVLGDGHWAVAKARAYLGPDQLGVRVESAPNPQASAGEAPTTVFEAVPPPARPGQVQPPSAENQTAWSEPPQAAPPIPAPRPVPAIEEPTIVQPVVLPRVRETAAPALDGDATAAHPGTGHPAPPGYPGAPGFAGGPGYPGAPSYPHGQAHPAGAGELFAPAYPPEGFNPYAQASTSPTGRKGLGVFAAIAAVLAAVIAVAALVFVLANRTSDPSDNDNVPTLTGPAPSDVELRDTGTTIRVSWTDPTEASVSFMVIMGRPGLELKPVGTLGPGQTSFEMSGLNATVNYCFAVVAVYRGDQFATSPQACTSRASATPR
ncbi:tetratricopeptide repeat protein [Actinoplanes sp. Pm04-4]|uniref:Tetratricopeptide repeat protein n=1 Tax=Paractinoplanes pyxinae TaxID=2997416 RepID=A0ABT4BC93_9ACTN|nr:tetratricopeptide repeat protein [Actinoplanes pyxinae]MCY1144131.1 tetratricopeptide repeat protein [Actinoplanes pyxinae]